MTEKDYYENPLFWIDGRYLENAEELLRFEAISSLIPDDVISLLDVGCGNGSFLKYLEDRKKLQVLHGVERSDTAISKRLCGSEIINSSCENLSFPDSSFDIVAALEVIEHLPKGTYEETLREFERVGSRYILISVPYKENFRHIECNYCGCRFSPYYHVRDFNKAKLVSLFNKFRLIKFKPVHPYKYYFIWDLSRHIWYHKFKRKLPDVPPYSKCPQCGNTSDESNSSPVPHADAASENRLNQFLKELTPYIQKHRWIVCLYEKI